MSDIIERLRAEQNFTAFTLLTEAADEIERLRAERDALNDEVELKSLCISGMSEQADKLAAERDAAVLRAERAESDIAKAGWRVYPFVHIRMDASESYKETALRQKLIALGWTPPTDAAIDAARGKP